MKGKLVIILLLLLVSSFVLAAETTEAAEKTTEKISAISGGLNNQTEDVLQNQVEIPAFFFIFFEFSGFKMELTWAELMVHIMFALIIFVFIIEALEFTMLENGWVKTLISLIILTIMIISGFLTTLSNLFYNIQGNLKIITWTIIILVIAFLFVKPIISKAKNQQKISKAKELGIAAGAALRGLKETTETVAKEADK